MNKTQAFAKLNPAGESLLYEICPSIEHVRGLTVMDLERILSLQDRITREGTKWRINGKKRQGGFLNIPKFQRIFFLGE